MRQRAVDGYGAAFSKTHNAYFMFPREHYEMVRDAWTSGKAFVTIPELYDGPGEQVLKLADVSAVERCPGESFAAFLARDAAEDRKKDLGL